MNILEEGRTMMICRSGKWRPPPVSTSLLCAILFVTAAAEGDTFMFVWEDAGQDLWSMTAGPPPTSTFIGGNNFDFTLPEIEEAGGVIYGSDSEVNTDFHRIDRRTGVVFETITLTFPPDGNVLTALEFVDGTLYAGLTTEGGGEDTYLSTVDLDSGVVTVVGQTNVGSPLGGLAYNKTNSKMYAISAGGSQAELFTINLATGLATLLGPVKIAGQGFKATALEFGEDGVLYSLAAYYDPLKGKLLSIDPVTLVATDLGSTGIPNPVALTQRSYFFADGFESGDTSEWSNAVQ